MKIFIFLLLICKHYLHFHFTQCDRSFLIARSPFNRFKINFNYTLYAGFGAGKNGHIARAAFAQPLLFSEVTHVPLSIIMGIKTAIDAIDCPLKISADKYEKFANEWLDHFHESGWEWSWLSPTVHMLFHHGGDIMRALPVSPSLLTGHVQIFKIETN